MTKTFKALLIDPISQTISLIRSTGSLPDILAGLSFGGHDCVEFEGLRCSTNDFLCIDGLGALTAPEKRLPSFDFQTGDGRRHTIYGRGILEGVTPSGDPTNVKMSKSQLANLVTWGDRNRAMMWKLSDGNNVGGDV